jgi:hypothetical protein
MYLPFDVDHKATILTILKNQLTQMESAGLPTSPEGLDALQVEENSTYPVCPEIDAEPITSTTEGIPSQLRTCPYSFTLTLPTFSTAAYGLLLLVIKQTSLIDNEHPRCAHPHHHHTTHPSSNPTANSDHN